MKTYILNLLSLSIILILSLNCGSSNDAPSVDNIDIKANSTADTANGMNLYSTLENFSFKPESLGIGEATNSEGYAEIVINGNVITRQYGPWHYFSKDHFNEGDNEISYILYNNKHDKIKTSSISTYHHHQSASEHHHKSTLYKRNEMMHHSMVMVKDDQVMPAITISASKDSIAGYNLKLELTNFIITPENVNSTHEHGKGHTHLYINGTKISRIYEEYYYIRADQLNQGLNTVKVELSSNEHSTYHNSNGAIDHEISITVE